MRRIVMTGALILAAAAPVFAQDSVWSRDPAVGLGPLFLHAQSPLTIFRLSPTPLTPETLPSGTWEAGTMIDWANYFDDGLPLYMIDAESARLSLGAAYGITDRLEVHAIFPVSYRGGGILDRFIENFERLVGMVNKQREDFPRNRYYILINGDDGTYQRSGRDAGWGTEDSVVGLRYQVLPGTETTPAVVAGLAIKFPTGRASSLYSSGGVDVSFELGAGQRLGRRFHLYGSLAATRFQQLEMAGVELTRTQFTWLGAVEYAHSPRTSYLVQALVTSPGAKHFGGFSQSTYEVSVGFKHLLRPDLMFEAAVTENVFVFSNSEDVAFHFGLVWRSPGSGRAVTTGGRT